MIEIPDIVLGWFVAGIATYLTFYDRSARAGVVITFWPLAIIAQVIANVRR